MGWKTWGIFHFFLRHSWDENSKKYNRHNLLFSEIKNFQVNLDVKIKFLMSLLSISIVCMDQPALEPTILWGAGLAGSRLTDVPSKMAIQWWGTLVTFRIWGSEMKHFWTWESWGSCRGSVLRGQGPGTWHIEHKKIWLAFSYHSWMCTNVFWWWTQWRTPMQGG